MVSVSIQDLRPNPQDTSAFYIEKMYQLQANPNASLPTNTTDVAKPPVFSAPRYAVMVNSCWLLSLVISLTCAMLATSAQQWARRYIKVTQPARRSPNDRARVRAFFANGMDKFHAPAVIEHLPDLIHFSLFLFFVGLITYLFNIDHTVLKPVLFWLVPLYVAYVCTIFIPN